MITYWASALGEVGRRARCQQKLVLFPTTPSQTGLVGFPIIRLSSDYRVSVAVGCRAWMVSWQGELGPSIAGAAVADLSGDFRRVVSSDFLVRRQVHALDPTTSWPENPLYFSLQWQGLTGIRRSEWTVLTLATAVRHVERVS